MRSIRCLALLLALPMLHTVQATTAILTYDPALAALMPNLDLGDGTVTSQLDLIRATAPDLSDVNFHLSPFIVPAAVTASKNFTTKPIAVTSMCLASSVGNSTGLTLAQIGAALLGSPSPTTTNIRWYLAPPSVSPSSASLLQALVLNSITSFTSNTAWPAAVLSNAKVQMLADDATISAVVNNCPPSMWCVGPQLGYASWAAPIQCLRIRRTVNVTGDTISYSSRLTASMTPYISVAPQYGTAYATGPVYPFIGGVYLSARKGVPCDVIDALTDMLTAFFTNTSNAAALESSGFQAVTTIVGFATLSLIVPYSGTNCTNKLLTAAISGDANLYDAAATLNFDAYGDGLNMVSFSTKLTSAALTEVYAVGSTRHAALVEAVPNATLKATKPSIVAAPVFAHGVALIYTLDGRDGLVASLCTMLGMLNGTIQYWDDPALKADNVGIQLPHLKITRIMAFDGSQEAAGRGVSYIARRCGLTLKTSYTSYPFATDVPAVWYNIVSQVQNTEGAIGLSTLSSAIAASMNQLAILFPSQLQVSGTQDDIAAVIAQSSLNTTTNAFKFPARTVDYFPFVSVVYAVVDTDASGGCEAYSRVLDWLTYVVGSRSQSVLVFGNQAVLSDSMRAVAASAIQRTMCDGVVLYPVPVEPLVWWPYAVIVAVVVAFIASIVGRAGYRHWVLSVRPMDPTKAIAVMFVGIKNQAAVLEAGEENAAAVHTRVAETVRALVRKHGCYEARRIDHATTMIVAKDATRAVACAEDIVLTLSVDVPWVETVMTHPMPQAKKYDIRGEMRRSETGSRTSGDLNTGRKSNHTPRTPNGGVTQSNSFSQQPTSGRHDALLQQLSAARCTPSTSPRDRLSASPTPRSTPSPPRSPLVKRVSNVRHGQPPAAVQRVPSQLESPHAAPSKIASSLAAKTQHTSTSHTGLTLQQCVPEVYAGVHWTHVMVDVQDDAVSYRGAGINTAACIADLAVGGQVIVSREFMDCLNVDLGDDDAGYHFATVGMGKSSDELVGLSLTTERFPEWLITRAALRRKSLEEKDGHDGNMIAAAMASADGTLAKRRIAVVSMLLRDLLREGADGRAAVVGDALAELLDIVTANRGQIHSITDGVVTATVGAGAPVAMAAVRAAQIAMEASELCVAIGVNSGSAMVGNAMGGKPATVGRVVAGAALMRAVAARVGVAVCATDVAKADLAAKFEVATVDLIASPWDHTKHIRCYAVVEERAQAEEGEWLYDMNDGFAPLEQRFDWHAKQQSCEGAPLATAHSAFLARQDGIVSLSDDLYTALEHATEGGFLPDFYTSRLSTLGQYTFSNGARSAYI